MSRFTTIANADLVAAGRDDFGFWDPDAAALIEEIRGGPHPVVKLGDIASVTAGITPAKEDYSYERGADDCLILKVANLSNAGVRWSEDRLSFVSPELFAASQRAHVAEGDILVLSAAHQRRYIGKRVDLVEAMPPEFVGRTMAVAELLRIRVTTDDVDRRFVLAMLRSPIVQRIVERLVRGQTGHLYPDDMAGLELPLPAQSVQSQIAARQVAVDRLATDLSDEIGRLQASVASSIGSVLMTGGRLEALALPDGVSAPSFERLQAAEREASEL